MFSKCSTVGLSMLVLAAAAIMVDANSCRAQSQNVPNPNGNWELIEYSGAAPGGTLDDKGQSSSRAEYDKQKLVFRKTF